MEVGVPLAEKSLVESTLAETEKYLEQRRCWILWKNDIGINGELNVELDVELDFKLDIELEMC